MAAPKSSFAATANQWREEGKSKLGFWDLKSIGSRAFGQKTSQDNR